MIDYLCCHMPGSPFRQVLPGTVAKPLTSNDLLACYNNFGLGGILKPEYDEESLQWLLEFTAEVKSKGELRQSLILDESGQSIGWYIYQCIPGQVSKVVHLSLHNRQSWS